MMILETSMKRLTSLCIPFLLIATFITAHADERSIAIRKKLAANSERRIALVIGNSSYQDAPLKNPVNDADVMTSVLKEAGFEVIVRKNADRRAMFSSIKEFGQKLRKNDVGLFYYAGHGLQVESSNYLLPVDLRGSDLQDADDLRRDALPLNELMERMRDAGTHNIVILDACRDNPFLAKLSRSASRGLAKVVTPANTSVLYSTDPGNTASDGSSGDNGVFTKSLAITIQKDGLELVDVMREVSVTVNRNTNGIQRPVFDGVLTSKFYFHPAESRSQQAVEQAATAITVDPKAVEFRYWESAERTNSISSYKSYLKKYPTGDFAELANEKLQVLEDSKIRKDESINNEIDRKAQEAAQKLLAKERAEQERRMHELESKRKVQEAAERELLVKERLAQDLHMRDLENERKTREESERKSQAKERAEQDRRMRELEAKFMQAEERARKMEEQAAIARQVQEASEKEHARQAVDKTSKTGQTQENSEQPMQVAMLSKSANANSVTPEKDLYKELLKSDLTISDTRSGLIWVRNGNISGDRINFDESSSFAKMMNNKKYAGYTDWRIPTIADYKTLYSTAKMIAIQQNKQPLAIIKEVFTNYQDWNYWVSTSSFSPRFGWRGAFSFDLEYGTSGENQKTDSLNIMLVRGAINEL